MTYDLAFDPRALKEWHKLGDTVRQQFKKKLAEILSLTMAAMVKLDMSTPSCWKTFSLFNVT
jgi:mRNA interferase RelE/StbE